MQSKRDYGRAMCIGRNKVSIGPAKIKSIMNSAVQVLGSWFQPTTYCVYTSSEAIARQC